jgi:hypothetical protein
VALGGEVGGGGGADARGGSGDDVGSHPWIETRSIGWAE